MLSAAVLTRTHSARAPNPLIERHFRAVYGCVATSLTCCDAFVPICQGVPKSRLGGVNRRCQAPVCRCLSSAGVRRDLLRPPVCRRLSPSVAYLAALRPSPSCAIDLHPSVCCLWLNRRSRPGRQPCRSIARSDDTGNDRPQRSRLGSCWAGWPSKVGGATDAGRCCPGPPITDCLLVQVLDDSYLVGNPTVLTAVAALLEHRPPRLRLVVVTRACHWSR